MSGANNIPLGRPGGQGGQLAQAASSLGGISLLNPSYLSGGAGPDPNERAASSSSSGRRSKFGPPVAGKKIFDMTSQKLRCLVLYTGKALEPVRKGSLPVTGFRNGGYLKVLNDTKLVLIGA